MELNRKNKIFTIKFSTNMSENNGWFFNLNYPIKYD